MSLEQSRNATLHHTMGDDKCLTSYETLHHHHCNNIIRAGAAVPVRPFRNCDEVDFIQAVNLPFTGQLTEDSHSYLYAEGQLQQQLGDDDNQKNLLHEDQTTGENAVDPMTIDDDELLFPTASQSQHNNSLTSTTTAGNEKFSFPGIGATPTNKPTAVVLPFLENRQDQKSSSRSGRLVRYGSTIRCRRRPNHIPSVSNCLNRMRNLDLN